MKVAIVGFGPVGAVLGGALLRNKAAEVKYGVRDPAAAKHKEPLAKQPEASLASIHDAVAWADAVILATPAEANVANIQAVAASLGPGIKGKVLLDATNPLTPYPALELRWDEELSGGEVLAAALPGTAVYKAFNNVGLAQLGAADGSLINGQRLTMLVAGEEDAEKRRVAEAVVEGVGFVPVYVGGIRYSRNLEAICELWIKMTDHLAGNVNIHLQYISSTP